MLFDLYWRMLGLPLSRIKGAVTDAIPFSVVEVALWAGAAAALGFLLSLGSRRGPLGGRRFRLVTLLLGPVFLVLLGLGQGAFPWSPAPTALREPLAKRLGGDSLPEETFRKWVAYHEEDLRRRVAEPGAWEAFQALPETTALAACDTALDRALAAFGLPPGRTVRAYKDMGPWTTALGILYGGPAFHDPFFSEIGIIRPDAYPAPHYWRLTAACHEAAHAKGFTREMDAEILTYFALRDLDDPRFRILGDIHFLRKTGVDVDWPDSVVADARRAAEERKRALAKRPLLMKLKRLLTGTPLQNSSAKYGERAAEEKWDPSHPFFSTILGARVRNGERGEEP